MSAGLVPAWPGVVQLVALPPLDLAADVRIVTAEATSPWTAGAGLVAAVAARSALLAACLGGRAQFGRALRFYLLALPVVAAAAAVGFAARAALYAWFFWAGLAMLVAIVAVGAAAPWDLRPLVRAGRAGWSERARTLPVVGGYLVALGALGAAAPGGRAALAVVPVSAALTWWTARWLAAPRPGMSRWGMAVAAVGVGSLVAALVAPAPGTPGEPGPDEAREGSVFLVPGVATSSGRGALFGFDPGDLGFTCEQTFYFSYEGTGGGASQRDARCPISAGAPYTGRDTRRPLDELAATFADQVAALPPPVVVITHSQGAWIAWAALATADPPPVATLVMLGPFTRTLAPYPPPGAHGPGYAGGAALRALTGAARAGGLTSFDPDAPLTRELQATPEAIEGLLARDLRRPVVAAAIEARWDLPLGAPAWPDGVVRACPIPATHAGLVTSGRTAAAINALLDGHGPGDCPAWVDWVTRVAAPFGGPPPR